MSQGSQGITAGYITAGYIAAGYIAAGYITAGYIANTLTAPLSSLTEGILPLIKL